MLIKASYFVQKRFCLIILLSCYSEISFAWISKIRDLLDIPSPGKTVCQKLDFYESTENLKALGERGSEFKLGFFSDIFPSKTTGSLLGRGVDGGVYTLCSESNRCDQVIKIYHAAYTYEEIADKLTTTPQNISLQNTAAALGIALPILQHGYLVMKDSSYRRFLVMPRAEGTHSRCAFNHGQTMKELLDIASKASIFLGDPHLNNFVVYNGQLFMIDFDRAFDWIRYLLYSAANDD